ncbi:MAG: CPBP family intramembrane metalloprotease [Acidobacteriia bacterium]|nr:CPBP family intramembrane metalloprotease [Terriglobia bacterium]
MREPITTADRRLILLVLAVVVLSVFFAGRNYNAAFPQASLDLRLSRQEITWRAETFLNTQQLRPTGFRNLTLFDPDDDARLFLERELGLEKANQLMAGEVAVWRWRVRWYKPPQKEEMVVYLSPDGRLTGFDHVIAEAEAGKSIEPAAAREIAERFLRQQSALPHKLVSEQKERRPHRTDHIFTWEREGFILQQATYRRTIVIHGDRVGSYSEYLHVPEKWERDFAALRSKNELYSRIAQSFYVPLIIAALVLIIQSVRRRNISWPPLILICGTVGALMVANEWNSLPFFFDGMPTSSTHAESLTLGILQGLGAGVGVFFYLILAAAPGETLYRAWQPQRLRLAAALSTQGIQTREFFRASLAGYGFAAAHLAFLVAFYLAGKRFGVWSPQDVSYSDLLSTSLPWLYPLTISLLAACSEEFWFRLLAVPLVRRLTGSTTIALLAPAFVWGFLHANYPQQPAYIRGIEVGLIGVAAAYLLLRFGILATLIWHYTIDAALIGSFLLQSGSWYFRLSGALVAGAVLFPLALSVWRYRRNGGFLRSPDLLNAAAQPALPIESSAQPALLPALPPTWNPRLLYFLAAILLGLGMLLQPYRFGDFIQLNTTREQAIQAVPKAPEGYLTSAEFVPNLDEAALEYVRRQSGPREAQRAVAEHSLTGLWRVRRFRPQEKREWVYYVNTGGRLFRTDHVLDEKALGADLTPPEARRIAEEYLASQQGLNLSQYRLVDSSHLRRDHRTDHSLVWEHTSFRIGEATARISLEILGDVPSTYRRNLKIPEQWLREFRRPRLQSYALPALGGSILLFLLIALVKLLGDHPFHWRIYLAASALSLAAYLAGQANEYPSFYAGYNTAVPVWDYTSDVLLGLVTRAMLIGFAVFLGALVTDVFLQLAHGRRRLPAPSLPAIASIAAVVWGYSRLTAFLEQRIPGDRVHLPLWRLQGLDTYLPALDQLTGALFAAMAAAIIAGTVLAAGAALIPPRRRYGWMAGISLATALTLASTPLLVLFHFLATLAGLSLLVFMVRTCAAGLLSLAPAIFLVEILSAAASYISQPSEALHTQGAWMIGAAMLLLPSYYLLTKQKKVAEP